MCPNWYLLIKLRCDTRFQRAFTGCGCVFKVIMLVGSNQKLFFENTTLRSKRMLKTRLATQLNEELTNANECTSNK